MAEVGGPEDESRALELVDVILQGGAKKEVKRSLRELELQSLAMSCSDGFVLLSPMEGTGAFADANVAQVFRRVADHSQRFPMRTPHSNLLLVGSRANPSSHDLRNYERVVGTARSAVIKQVGRLPPAQRDKLVLEALQERIVLFYTLDSDQRDDEIKKLVRMATRSNPTESHANARARAEQQFLEERGDMERTEAFNAAFTTMVQQMLLRMEDFRGQIARDRLERSRAHFLEKQQLAAGRASAKKEIEALSERYHREQGARETAWKALETKVAASVARAEGRTLDFFTKDYLVWEDPDAVERFLRTTYENKAQAKQFAPDELQTRLSQALQDAVLSNIRAVEVEAIDSLKEFDKTFLQRREGEINIQDASGKMGDVGFSRVEPVSALATFSSITLGIAGGTTLLATAGSTLATAALAKVLALGVGIASSFGAGAALTGLLLGIPVAGWVVLGLGAVYWALRGLLTDWQVTMAKAIAKSAKKSRHETLGIAKSSIADMFKAAKSVLRESLDGTKRVIDGHIQQTHDIATGAVTADDLQSAVLFYKQHVELMKETLEQFGAPQ